VCAATKVVRRAEAQGNEVERLNERARRGGREPSRRRWPRGLWRQGGPRLGLQGKGLHNGEGRGEERRDAVGLKGLRAASKLSKIYTIKENFRSRIRM